MKNLELLELVHSSVDIFSGVEIFTQSSDTIYFLKNKCLYKYDFTQKTHSELYPEVSKNVIQLRALTIENKICMVTPDKLHIFDPNGRNELHTLTFDIPIATVSWNPTEELVVIVASNGDVATYSVDYENGEVFPQGRSSINAKIPDTVYVGWGSKETQFRGSEGKLKKQTPVVEKPIEDKKPTVSWRGNGEMFVVNYWVKQKRKFVVFETPCHALYQSEECPGLQAPMAWRPTGNMIATLTEIGDEKSIVIFEKNGQKRFSFDVNFGDVRVRSLKWSPCAQILTIHTENLSTNSQTIHLYMSSNYKWYEKQTLIFKENNLLLDFDWVESTQFTFTLRVITRLEILRYTFRNLISKSSAVCAVIDGKTVQLTDFNDAVIPPIMFSEKIENNNPINSITLEDNQAVILDAENYLKIFRIDNCELINSINLEELMPNGPRFPLTYHHIMSKGSDIYFATESDSESVLYHLKSENPEINFLDATTEPLRHLLIIPDSTATNLKKVVPTPCINGTCHSVQQDVTIIDNKTYNCYLTSSCHFYVNDQKINECVNSFIIFDRYLLYTTKLNELYCLRFNQKLFDDQNYRRSIEQGATLVAAIPNSPKIILQLPRGNLETISCRLISIDILDYLLAEEKWSEALRFIRLEKLNANLLFDLDPNRFLEKIDHFIHGVKTINELNNICLEFEGGNVLNKIYKNWGKSQEFPGKMDAIFSGILSFFDRVDYVTYITTIMIININFFTLRHALVYLQDLLRRSYNNPTLKQKLIDAVNTLKTYGCNQEKLYSESLLLYDIDLAHFVASCCQLDPRVYEPQLNNLKNLPEIERRYEINVFGKKPKVAIKYLLKYSKMKSEEILTFIENHKVSREAYECCSKNNRHHQVVSKAFAHDVSKHGWHQEAGIILKRGGLLKEALEEFKSGLQWKEVVSLMGELKFGEVERLTVVNDMASRLTQCRMVKDAAILYEFNANNYEMAVKILIENYLLEDAVHIAKKYNRNDIIVSDIVPVLNKHKNDLEEKLTELNETYSKYRKRLSEVRKNKMAKFNNIDYDDDDRDDLCSDVGSTITKSSGSWKPFKSRSSTRSSRNRWKEERKKQDLRKGGVYEDIALIKAVHWTIKDIYDKGKEVKSCCLLLLQESDILYSEVKKFHELYRKIEMNVKNGIAEIWPPHFHINNQTQNVQELADLENIEHLDVAYRTPPSGQSWWPLGLF